ncbi:glycosyltransferase [Aerophototrophica crusticola]|uniref:Glycosyltransferase n=1 Tax=Aerophototrophica crusticola TaxID=1709002 RepID=A0A858R4U4_9PROT|nr:glycosyltransferase [Rhodospirillaceae bacterium B3]
MRVLQMIFSRNFRGAERHVADLANGQAGRHDLLLLLRADHEEDGASIMRALDPAVPVRLVRPSLLGWDSWRAARAFRPDVVHSHGGRAGKVAGAWLRRWPRLATMHLDYRPAWYRRQDALVAPTGWQAEDARAKGFTGSIHRLDLWVKPALPLTPGQVAALRAELGAGPGTALLGAVGALIPVKGFDTLVQAFRRLPGDHLRLALVGQGPQRAELESLAQGDPRIRFAGFRDDAASLYQAFDLFAFPSREEPFGLVALEALDAGLPVVATDTKGARATLGPGGLVPPGDVDALTSALAARLSQSLTKHRPDLSRWSMERHLVGLDEVYQGLRRSD